MVGSFCDRQITPAENGLYSLRRHRLTGIKILMINDRPIFIMDIPIPVNRGQGTPPR